MIINENRYSFNQYEFVSSAINKVKLLVLSRLHWMGLRLERKYRFYSNVAQCTEANRTIHC